MTTPLPVARDRHDDSGQRGVQSARLRWWVLLCVGASSVCGGITGMVFAPLIGDVARDTGVDIGTASFVILGLAAFVTSLALGVVGFLIDRLGVFKVMVGGQALVLISTAAIPLAGNDFNALVALRLVQSLGAAGLMAAIMPAIARWFDPGEIGRALGIQAIGVPIGLMLALYAAPMLSRQLGSWHWGIALVGLAPAVALLITLAVAVAARNAPPAMAEGGVAPPPAAGGGASFVRLPMFWVGLVSVALCFSVGLAFMSLTPGYLAVATPVGAGYGPEGAGTLMFVHALAGAAGPLLGGLLLDKVFGGRSRILISVGWVLSALLYTSVIWSPVAADRVVLMAVLLVAGFANPFVNLTLMSYAAKAFPAEVLGRISGLWLSAGTLAGSGAVMVGSLALQATGDYRLAFLMIGGGSLIGLAIAQFLRTPQQSEAVRPGASSLTFEKV